MTSLSNLFYEKVLPWHLAKNRELAQVSLLHSYTLLAHWIKSSLSSLFTKRKQLKGDGFHLPGSVYGTVGAGYRSGFIFSSKLALLWQCTLKTAVRGEKAVLFPLRNNLCVCQFALYVCINPGRL